MAIDVSMICFPYCLEQQTDKSWCILNRFYKPVGAYLVLGAHMRYENYPVSMRIQGLTPAKLKALTWNGEMQTGKYYLYDGSCRPTRGKQCMDAYLKKLRILMARL